MARTDSMEDMGLTRGLDQILLSAGSSPITSLRHPGSSDHSLLQPFISASLLWLSGLYTCSSLSSTWQPSRVGKRLPVSSPPSQAALLS